MDKLKDAKQFEMMRHYVEAVATYQSIIDKRLNTPKKSGIISKLATLVGRSKRKKAEKKINAMFTSSNIPPSSSNAIGEMYYSGMTAKVNRNDAKAFLWFNKAEAEGSTKASRNIGLMYENGRGLAKSYIYAAKYYQKAIEAGLASTEVYLNGLSKKEDITAEQLCEIGKMLYLKKEYKKASDWYEKAIEKGSALAYKYMGMAYEFGKGVGVDYVVAAEYYAKAYDRNFKKSLDDIERILKKEEIEAAKMVLIRKIYETRAESLSQNAKKNLTPNQAPESVQSDNSAQSENKDLEKQTVEDKEAESSITCAC